MTVLSDTQNQHVLSRNALVGRFTFCPVLHAQRQSVSLTPHWGRPCFMARAAGCRGALFCRPWTQTTFLLLMVTVACCSLSAPGWGH